MGKVYDIRNLVNRGVHGVHASLTIRDYTKVPVGAVFISFSQYRDTSRWVTVERKRPFEVAIKAKTGDGWYNHGWFKTLEAAVKAAEKLAIE
jgi:hypothetical protein